MRPAVLRPLLLALTVISILSCSSSKGTSTTDAGNSGGASGGVGAGGNTGGAQAGANGTGNGGGSIAGAAGSSAAGPGGKAGGAGTGVAGVGGTILCGQTKVPLQPIAPDVLIVLDNSGSMSDDSTGLRCPGGCGADSKWAQVTTAIEDVVMTTQATVNWGLKFMDDGNLCGVPPGVAVDVGPGADSAISTALALVQPGGQTPTESAITSAVTYLQGRTDPNSKYILLATDGLPNCKPNYTNPNDDDSAGAEAALEAARTAGFDTFVLGIATNQVGVADTILNAMAVAGGEPRPAGSVPLYYLASDTATLESALTTIAAKATPCSFALPAAPAGSTLAISAATSAGSVTIAKDPANGWAAAADMKSIALNGTACASARSGVYTSIDASYLCSP